MYCLKSLKYSHPNRLKLCACCILLRLVKWIVEKLRKRKAQRSRQALELFVRSREISLVGLLGLQMDGHLPAVTCSCVCFGVVLLSYAK